MRRLLLRLLLPTSPPLRTPLLPRMPSSTCVGNDGSVPPSFLPLLILFPLFFPLTPLIPFLVSAGETDTSIDTDSLLPPSPGSRRASLVVPEPGRIRSSIDGHSLSNRRESLLHHNHTHNNHNNSSNRSLSPSPFASSLSINNPNPFAASSPGPPPTTPADSRTNSASPGPRMEGPGGRRQRSASPRPGGGADPLEALRSRGASPGPSPLSTPMGSRRGSVSAGTPGTGTPGGLSS